MQVRPLLGLVTFAVLCLVGASCGESTVELSAGASASDGVAETESATPEVATAEVWEDVVAIQEEQAQPGTRPDDAAEPLSATQLDALLLDQRDLAGADVIGPMSFADEPQYTFVDCDVMVDVFAAHEGSGRRIRAQVGDGALRMSAVDLGDVSSATVVLDAADAVWETCGLATTDVGNSWWIEPIEMPGADGWRAAGIAIGVDPDLIWTIGWYQRGSVVVFADLDAANPWDLRRELDAAIAARLTGGVDAIDLAPEPPILQEAPTATPASVATPPPSPTPAPDTSWLDHPAARYVPEADFFGPDWTREPAVVVEAGPADPDDVIDGCDVAPPPQMAGLEVEYEPSPWADVDNAAGPMVEIEIEIIVGVGDTEAAAATLEAFRLVANCPVEALEGIGFAEVPVEIGAADEAVALEVADVEAGFTDATVLGRVVLARYGPDLVGVFYGVFAAEGEEIEAPSFDELAGWLDQWAAAANG